MNKVITRPRTLKLIRPIVDEGVKFTDGIEDKAA